MTTTTTNTSLTNDKPAKRTLRQQWADLVSRYEALPTRQRWVVIAALSALGFVVVNEYSWSYAREWSARSAAIEEVLKRSSETNQLITPDLTRQVATYGPVTPPRTHDEGGEALTRSIEEILGKHKVVGLNFDRRSGQRMRDPEGSIFGGAGLDRLQADVKFETEGDKLAAILADLEGNENIAAVSTLRIQGPGTEGGTRVIVQATIEAWVQAGRGRRTP